MTDNNADETNGQRTNLSRRGAVALLGTAAVGGTAATGAFSKLTADRPIDVQVVSNGDSELGADNTTSTLRITNNVNEDINATVNVNDIQNISLVNMRAPNETNLTSTNQSSWELTNLNQSSTAEVVYEHNTANTSVSFDVEAFSGTNGYSIGATQAVDVQKPPASAVARYTFDTAHTDFSTSPATITDLWGSYDGTLNGPKTGAAGTKVSETYTGEAYDFDGSNDRIAVPHDSALNLTGDFAIAAWVKTDALNSPSTIAYKGANSTNAGEYYLFMQSDGAIGFDIPYVKRVFSSGPIVSSNEWTHIVFTRSSDTYTVYLDGSSEASKTDTSSQAGNTTNALEIGMFNDGSRKDWFNGKMSDLRFYDTALTSTEVSNLYSSGTIK